MLLRSAALGSGKPAIAPAGRNRCGSTPLRVVPLFTAKPSGSMPTRVILRLAAPRSASALAGPSGPRPVYGSDAASPCNMARLSGSIPTGVCYDWQHRATLLRWRAPPDLVWLWGAIATPCARSHGRRASSQCAETRNSYVVVAGRGDAIRAVGAVEAVRALEAIFRGLVEPFVASCP